MLHEATLLSGFFGYQVRQLELLPYPKEENSTRTGKLELRSLANFHVSFRFLRPFFAVLADIFKLAEAA